jgi:hypothetical protein
MATIEVARSRRADANGVFTDRVWGTGYESRPDGKPVRVTPERSSPDPFWNKPGIYYWHVIRVVCPFTGPRPHTCTERAGTRTRSFRIRATRRSRRST